MIKVIVNPKEMLELGVFGGKYMTDCRSEFPEDFRFAAIVFPAIYDAGHGNVRPFCNGHMTAELCEITNDC